MLVVAPSAPTASWAISGVWGEVKNAEIKIGINYLLIRLDYLLTISLSKDFFSSDVISDK